MRDWLLRWVIGRVERHTGQPLIYCRRIGRAAPAKLLWVLRFFRLTEYRRDLFVGASHVARLVATRHEDCGPALQSAVNLAARDGVSAEILEAVVAGRPQDLPGRLPEVYRFAESILQRRSDLPECRQRIEEIFGERALIELSLQVAASRGLPTLRHALGDSCPIAQTCISFAQAANPGAGLPPPGTSRADRLGDLYSAPRRFDLATLFAVSVAYSLMLTALRLLGTPSEWLVFAALLVSAVGLGQATLFGGRKPRLASVLVGAVLLMVWLIAAYPRLAWGTALVCPLLAGMGLGYLSGALVGGVFLVADLLRPGSRSGQLPSESGAGIR